MSLTVQATGKASGDYQPTPAGNHVAVCYQMIDLGQQYNEKYDTWQHKIQIGWELSNELMEDGRPFVVSSRYTASFNEKAILRRDLESWRGRPFTDAELAGFDLKNILGKACMVNVVHNTKGEKTYANVKSVAALPKGMPSPEQINDTVLFELGDQGFDQDAFAALPEWMRNTIMQSKDYQALQNDAPVVDEWSDEITF